tara:strand:+ start:180 stop:734 length:555 start_codon:yes stop_codon:yes gene_type:complete
MESVANSQQKPFFLKDLIPKIQRKSPESFLVEEAICTTIIPGVKCSPRGDEYRLARFETPAKQTGIFLVCETKWNLELVEYLPNQKVKFLITEGGLQLKRIHEQPFLTQQHIADSVGVGELKVKKKKDNISQELKPTESNEITTSVEVVEKTAGVLLQKAAESGMALALGIYYPPNLFSQKKNN